MIFEPNLGSLRLRFKTYTLYDSFVCLFPMVGVTSPSLYFLNPLVEA